MLFSDFLTEHMTAFLFLTIKTRCCMLRRAKNTPFSFICKSHGKQEVDVR